MKNIMVYYFVVIVPLAIVFLLELTNMITSNSFVYLFCFYVFFIEPTLMERLANKGMIEKRYIWKMIVPGKRLRFFTDLYLR